MTFNLDLNLIEKRLTQNELFVKSALVLPELLKTPLSKDTVFVMLLEDVANDANAIGGDDIEQYVTERFAVLIGVRSPGDATGVNSDKKLNKHIHTIKSALIGLFFGDFEPIEFEAGRVIDVNRQTHNVLYQLQFKTAHTVVTEVKHYDEIYQNN